MQWVSNVLRAMSVGAKERVCFEEEQINASYTDGRQQSQDRAYHALIALSKALKCLSCCWMGQPVSIWQVVEMGWPDIHRLARDKSGLVAAVMSWP
jgi:hypothetical protein